MPVAKTKARVKPAAKTAGVNKVQPAKTGMAKAKIAKTKTAKAGASLSGPKKNSYDPVAPARVQDILNRLDQRYPNVTCALYHKSAWELLIATILSAQCTDVMVNKVTPILFQKYPTPQAMAAAMPEELEPILRPTGFYRNKAKSVVGASKGIIENFGGQVPDEMERILTLPGVARKTANVVLGTWFKKAVGVVVDTHVHRISRRLELTRADDPKNIEQDLMKVIPQEKWIEYSNQIIHHGRALCIARRPKCAECPLETICRAADKTWSTVEIHKAAQP
ncbi:MAG TPA: endonuclease III [Candidatus Angelobacter sp.]|nr:endonuclease III [Candidatus Angelobacter sp.]